MKIQQSEIKSIALPWYLYDDTSYMTGILQEDWIFALPDDMDQTWARIIAGTSVIIAISGYYAKSGHIVRAYLVQNYNFFSYVPCDIIACF